VATDNDTSFDAALAALDVEHYVTDKGWRSNILGLDAVRAAHRAEVDALREKLTRVLGAIQRLQPTGSPIPGDEVVLAEWIVGEAISARAAHRAEVERVARDAVLRALHVERNEGLSKTTKAMVDEAVAAAIRARGVAKPRTDGEAPAAADEGAKS